MLGPSGCGKSTLLRVVADLIAATSGELEVLGGSAATARARRDIGFVFQDASLLAWRTALENVNLPLEVGGRAKRRPGARPSRTARAGRARGLGERAPARVVRRHAPARRDRPRPRQRPQAALDGRAVRRARRNHRDRLNEELLRIWENTGATILFVTHSIYEAAFLGQNVLLMAARPGRVREIVPVPFPGPRFVAMRETPEFVELAAHLRRVLETC